MDSENLIAELVSHVSDQVFSSTIFNPLHVIGDEVLFLEGETSNTVFPILNSSLSINMRFKILLKLVLVVQVVLLPLVDEEATCEYLGFIYPLDCWISKLLGVDINKSLLKSSLCPFGSSCFFHFLPSSCVFWIFNELLRLVIVLVLSFLDALHSSVHSMFLLSDILSFNSFPEIS